MNTKANAVLDNIRTTLEAQLSGKNLTDADLTEGDLTEAEIRFCEEGLAFIKASGYEMDVDECGPEEVVEALEFIADDDASIATKVEEFFKLHNVVEVE